MGKINTITGKNLLSSLLGLSLISISTMVSAEVTRIGVGISATDSTSIIKVPLDLGKLRIEPEFGYSRNKFTTNNDSRTATDFQIGSGVYLLNPVTEDIDLYYGGKALIIRTDLGGASDTGLEFVAIAGFEYYVDKQVSIGGEVGFGIGSGDFSNTGTQTGVVLRYYTK